MNKYVKNIVISIGVIFLCNFSIFSQEIPPTPSIQKVSVDTSESHSGKVVIFIYNEGALESTEFVIMRHEVDQGGPYHQEGFLIIDTVPMDINSTITKVIDTLARADLKPERYKIYADVLGSSDPFNESAEHKTIFLEIEKNDSCSKTHKLVWTPYVGISGMEYEIRKKNIAGIDPHWEQLTGKSTDTSDIIENINYYEEYTYQIWGRKDGILKTFSNEVTVKTLPLDPINLEKFYVDLIENSGTQIDIGCHVDDTADLLNYQLFQENDYSKFIGVESIDYTIGTNYIYFNYQNNISEKKYKVLAINSCKDTIYNNLDFKPLVLNYELKDQNVLLNWNASYSEDETYEVELTIDSNPTQTLPPDSFRNFSLNLDSIAFENNENFCFKIVATTAEGYKSFSNTICIPKTPRIKMYNAFTPNGDGLNDKIGPDFLGAVITELDYIIYNKFGEKIYHATNPDPNIYDWDGTYKGLKVQEGGYLYYIRIKTSLGKELEKSGVISVIYP